MLSAKEIRNRIKSVHDTRKITNAMYMISSIKMRRAKRDLDRTRPYFHALQTEIKRIFRTVEEVENRYFYPLDGSEAPDGTYGILVITADRGLAGSYNKSVINHAQRLISQHSDYKLFVVGEYGRQFFSNQQIAIEESFRYSAQNTSMNRAREISTKLLDLFDKGEIDKIFVVYSDLEEGLDIKVKSTRLLPFHRKKSVSFIVKDEIEVTSPFEFFPSLEEVIDNTVRGWLSGYIFSALVGSFCSEQSARMTAMNSANNNAEKILDSLTIQYNQLRQAEITREITEVTSGVKAQKRKGKKEVVKP